MVEEDRNILALVGLALPMREALNPPKVSPGGDDVRVDGLAERKLLDLLVVYSELEDRGVHDGGLRLRLCRLSPLVHGLLAVGGGGDAIALLVVAIGAEAPPAAP